MVPLLILISSITSIIGNAVAKYWADTNQPAWLILMFLSYMTGSLLYAIALRLGGHFTIVNALFYAIVPIMTVLTGVFLFKDRLTALQTAGLVLGVIAIFLITIEGKITMPKIH